MAEPCRWAALALLLVAGYVQQQRRVVLDDVPEEPELVAVARYLERETDPDDFVVSDHSIVPFLADRRVAGPLVDTAVLRFETGSLTDAEVMRVLESWDVRAVVAGRAFAARPQLLRRARATLRRAAAGGRDSGVLRVDVSERASGLLAGPLLGRLCPGGCAESHAQVRRRRAVVRSPRAAPARRLAGRAAP